MFLIVNKNTHVNLALYGTVKHLKILLVIHETYYNNRMYSIIGWPFFFSNKNDNLYSRDE